MTSRASGRVEAVTLWPVKSMAGGVDVPHAAAQPAGLAGDREYALVDRRALRDGHVVSARNVPGLLRWSAARAGAAAPVVTAPGGQRWDWHDPAFVPALRADLGVPLEPAGPGRFADLADSVLVTTTATHRDVSERFGRELDRRRWRTNLVVDVDAPAFAEAGWQGAGVTVGDVELSLLHPCRRCAIPTWAPDGGGRAPELLRWFLQHSGGVFGINARVVRAGTIAVGDPVLVR
jgi:uncharacterized protein YcbX